MEDDEEFRSLAAALAAARKMRGLTQKQAAALIGMSHRSWQDWERGEGDAVTHLADIEVALDLPRDYFVSKLTVLERLVVFESRLERIEGKLAESQDLLRNIYGFLQVRG